MSSTDVIKELLVSLGWSHDEQSRRKVVDAEKKTTRELGKEQKERDVFDKKRKESTREAIKGFQELSIGVTAAAGAIVGALGVMGKAFESAYYSASRTGSSVRELDAFKYAMSQMGSSAEEAQAAVEGLAQAMRNQPGLKSVLTSLGAKHPDDATKALNEIAPRLAQMPIATAERFAQMLQIPEKVLLAMRDTARMKGLEGQANSKYGILGFDPGKAADDGTKLTQSFRDLRDTMVKISEKAGSSLFRDLAPQLKSLNDFLLAHGKEISETATKIGDALFKMFDYVVRHIPDIDHFATSIGGWTTVLNGLAAAVSVAMIGRVASLFASLGGIAAMAPPGWMLALLGVAGYAGYQALKGQGPSSGAEGSYQENRAAERSHPGESGIGRLWRKGKRWLGVGGRRGFMNRGKGGGSNAVPYAPTSLTGAMGISPDEYNAFKEGLTDIEGKDYGHMGGAGKRYAGRYQMGPSEIGETAARLGVPRPSYAEFLSNPALQEKFFENYTLDHYKTLMQHPRFAAMSNDEKLKMLGYAHNQGAGSPRNGKGAWGYLDSGRAGTDAWGTSGTAYFGPIGSRLNDLHSHLKKIPPMMKGGSNALPMMINPPSIGGKSPYGGLSPVTMNQHNHVTVSGVSDPTSAAAHIGARQSRNNSMLFRNLQSAVG